jgi:hypothetical protein
MHWAWCSLKYRFRSAPVPRIRNIDPAFYTPGLALLLEWSVLPHLYDSDHCLTILRISTPSSVVLRHPNCITGVAVWLTFSVTGSAVSISRLRGGGFTNTLFLAAVCHIQRSSTRSRLILNPWWTDVLTPFGGFWGIFVLFKCKESRRYWNGSVLRLTGWSVKLLMGLASTDILDSGLMTIFYCLTTLLHSQSVG